MNTRMMLAAAVACVTLALAPKTQSAELTLPKDGWASWEVDAVEGAPYWCCWKSWNENEISRASCKLDRDSGNFGSRDRTTTDKIRVYARLAGGKVERLRVLSPACPVETETPIREITTTTDDSARWLSSLAKRGAEAGRDPREQSLAALAMHRGDLAQNELVSIARTDESLESRKHAVFWLAQLRGVSGAKVATDLMFNSKDPDLRKHAAFAISQSKSPSIAADLTRLGNTDKDGDVRAQAWFWLAQTGAANAETAILEALRKDDDHQVREHAILALSQLPDERATRALIAAAEDRSLSQEQRKRAVFWLGQSESKVAQAYLDKVLTGSR